MIVAGTAKTDGARARAAGGRSENDFHPTHTHTAARATACHARTQIDVESEVAVRQRLCRTASQLQQVFIGAYD